MRCPAACSADRCNAARLEAPSPPCTVLSLHYRCQLTKNPIVHAAARMRCITARQRFGRFCESGVVRAVWLGADAMLWTCHCQDRYGALAPPGGRASRDSELMLKRPNTPLPPIHPTHTRRPVASCLPPRCHIPSPSPTIKVTASR